MKMELNQFNNPTILIVDDNKNNLKIMTDCLKGENYKLLIAQNGESALEKVKIVKPDLIVMDVLMPGIDGFETCRRLKVDENLKEIPVIFMTALSDTQSKLKGFEVGGIDFISKPFQSQEVLCRLSIHLKLQQQNRSLQQQALQLEETNNLLEKEVMIRRAAEEKLQLAHNELEKRVIERTAEFIRVNEQLNKEIADHQRAEEELMRAHNELESTQKELFFTLGEIAETRSNETGNHVRRVGEITEILALKYGMSKEAAEHLKLAASMHDIGKLAIYDNILNNPGPLNEAEFEIMKSHAKIGYDMLKSSKKELLQASAIIAHQHHENYNGTGYPSGLKGEEIYIGSKIVAIADVFDALGNKRCYKGAWSTDDIIEYFKSEKGKKFDPTLIELLFENIDEIVNIRVKLPG